MNLNPTGNISAAMAACFLLSPLVPAQLAINEVLVDPVGNNTGKQIVEVINVSGNAFTATGWQICAPFTYAAIPQVQIPKDGIVRFHLGATGNNSASDFFFPRFRNLGVRDEFMIYKSANFNVDADIIDYVSWGGGNARIAQAVRISQWPSATATVALPAGEGKTIAWDGMGNSHNNWVASATNTIGTSNRIAAFTAFGKACGVSGVAPKLAAAAGVRPSLNSTFSLDVTGLPTARNTPVFGIIGFAKDKWSGNKLPLDLAFLGAPGCFLNISFDFQGGLTASGGTAKWMLGLPNDSKLLGIRFYTQVYAGAPSANAAGIVVSNALEGEIGN